MATLSEHSEALAWGLDQLRAALDAGGVLTDPEIGEAFAHFREAVEHVRFAAVYEEISISQREAAEHAAAIAAEPELGDETADLVPPPGVEL